MKKVNSLGSFATVEQTQNPEKLNVFTDVVFQIRAETELSETVAVCGDCFQLGFWQANDALKLITTHDTYPIWTGCTKLPQSVPVNYKYVKIGAKEPQWEIKVSRSFTTTGTALYIDDGVFGVPPDPNTSRIRVDFKSPSFDTKFAANLKTNSAPKTTTVILVLYRLPVTPHKTEQGWKFDWNDDALYFTSLGLKRGMAEKTRLLWLGWPSVYIPPEEQEQVAKTLLEEHNCIPVFLPETGMVYEHYHGFCKEELWMAFHNVIDLSGSRTKEYNRTHWQAYLALNSMFAQTVIENYDDSAVIWIHDYHLLVLPTYLRRRHPPAFHNVIDLSGTHSREYNRSHWQAYLTLNAMFAQTVIENYDDSAVVWIHDYHLLVLPTYLRRKHPPAKIGIFLHTPFPSSEVYRTIPVREDLLRGMLSASLVGFHLFDYARHFLSCCTRMLGLQFESRRGGFLGVEYNGRVIENYDDSAVIWIHDYHLLVLPTYLRRRHPPAKIGIFLHTPFPSSEVFRTIPVREDLLRGMLSASLVGFHLFDYARHFLSCCTRMLGLQFESRRGGFLGVEYNGRHVMVRVSHVGIDPERFLSRMEDADVIESTEVLARKFENKVVLLGIDDMDKLKGVPLKMLAMEHLLENYPCWRNKVVL
eukprot:CAMPEP_0196666694 /NCGR_PEP_ID=MMETSP1086-20130531/64661_1 /TAXON_ID=77921 /ORGANISM="Cyanoptyche  gloeocystis , Strain SAG4.97" /LENGTH=642 /DNA_ID=CAMNT_0042003923 /DNA_START=143 /DNA_END=2068 /DNA_ORIENTATION=+